MDFLIDNKIQNIVSDYEVAWYNMKIITYFVDNYSWIIGLLFSFSVLSFLSFWLPECLPWKGQQMWRQTSRVKVSVWSLTTFMSLNRILILLVLSFLISHVEIQGHFLPELSCQLHEIKYIKLLQQCLLHSKILGTMGHVLWLLLLF